ncbi:nucleotidyltransferase [Panacibacter sp. DH6]|uniref:Nucleotidyltransferase n=1 Tax=Panacibacter microcysteis TaxID=2793269 RepID=A0A931GTT5_9BACT|nr:sugar phosphate nucleotidyltransferase [Panacibacter microcysteis]MBG9374680.1 nucleotidyltransferase [Panacibacter microcysteis]
MQPTLVILAAGMASRYGSMKQIQGFGPSSETIMEYSIYDAIAAGFTKVVFIIRKDFADDFKALIEPKLKGKIDIGYVYQQLDAFTGNHQVPADRVKPWGTAHAVLCCKDAVKEPFAVINADDFYGKDAFVKAYEFLTTKCTDQHFAVIGYELVNTLSEHGSVSRGVIAVNDSNEMKGIDERLKIYRKDGKIVYEENDQFTELQPDTKVSMNFFCFTPEYINMCEEEFDKFLSGNLQDLKSEFLIPRMADHYIKSGRGVIEIVPTTSKWFGVTYKEDAPIVKASVDALVAAGEYPSNLWA